jgi:hypothetical protein
MGPAPGIGFRAGADKMGTGNNDVSI